MLFRSNPEILTKKTCFVDVELTGDYCRGETVVDRYGVWGQEANVDLVFDIERENFVDLICSALESYGEVEQ